MYKEQLWRPKKVHGCRIKCKKKKKTHLKDNNTNKTQIKWDYE